MTEINIYTFIYIIVRVCLFMLEGVATYRLGVDYVYSYIIPWLYSTVHYILNTTQWREVNPVHPLWTACHFDEANNVSSFESHRFVVWKVWSRGVTRRPARMHRAVFPLHQKCSKKAVYVWRELSCVHIVVLESVLVTLRAVCYE